MNYQSIVQNIRNRNGFIIASIFVAILFILIAWGVQAIDGFRSSELAFTDASHNGLSIVPASCPSDPQKLLCDAGATMCDESIPCPPPAGCILTTTADSIAPGDSIKVAWNTKDEIGGDYTLTVRPTTGLATVSTTSAHAGFRIFTPASNTTYTFEVTRRVYHSVTCRHEGGKEGYAVCTGGTSETQSHAKCEKTVAVVPTTTVALSPTPPTITQSLCSGTSMSFTFLSFDPNGDSLHYGVDWNADAIIDQWLPGTTTYVTSGTSQAVSHTWPTNGVKPIQVKAQDQGGLFSGWSLQDANFQCQPGSLCKHEYFCGSDKNQWLGDESSTTCQRMVSKICEFDACRDSKCPTPDSPDADLIAFPKAVRAGETSNLYWNTADVDVSSCTLTGTNGDSWPNQGHSGSDTTLNACSATCGTGYVCVMNECVAGQSTKSINASARYTLRCKAAKTDAIITRSKAIGILPTFIER